MQVKQSKEKIVLCASVVHDLISQDSFSGILQFFLFIDYGVVVFLLCLCNNFLMCASAFESVDMLC